jgi:hypothetical protein
MSDPFNDPQNSNDELSTGLKVLSFCIPLAGAIIYFTSKSESPKKAKTACNAALLGIGLGLIIQVIFVLLGIGAGSM